MGVPRVPPRAASQAINPTFARYLDDLRRAEQAAVEPMADALRRNDRTRALVQGRLDRIAPEQRPSSLGLVARQYMDDLDAARASDIRLGRDMNTAGILAAGGLAGAGAFGMRMAMENDQNQQDATLMEAWEGERQQREAEQLAQDNAIAEVARAEQAENRRRRADDSRIMAGIAREVGELDFAEDPGFVSPVTEEDVLRGSLSAQLKDMFGEPPQYTMMPDSPDDAVAAAPGPMGDVREVVDLEDLPGPQKRSIMALMRGGIPEGRAVDIILKGSSMSPDEYRMVTGGRR